MIDVRIVEMHDRMGKEESAEWFYYGLFQVAYL